MQMAGTIYYYDESDHLYLRISYDEKLGKNINIITQNQGIYDEPTEMVSVEGWDRCYLKVTIQEEKLQFLNTRDGGEWGKLGPVLIFGQLPDE